MNGEASNDFMNRVSAWMSTVWPTILNLICLASAKSESERALFSRSRSSCFCRGDIAALAAVSALAVAPFFTTVSAIATLFGELVCETWVSQVYCGKALLISYIRCDHR